MSRERTQEKETKQDEYDNQIRNLIYGHSVASHHPGLFWEMFDEDDEPSSEDIGYEIPQNEGDLQRIIADMRAAIPS